MSVATSLAESGGDDLGPQALLRIEKIERRLSYDADEERSDLASKNDGASTATGGLGLGQGSRVVEKHAYPGQILPDFIRLRPDLRPSIADDKILQWKSVSHPQSTNTRLELQAKTIAAAETAAATRGAWDDESIGNRSNNSPTTSAKASFEELVGANRSILVSEGINPEALITHDVRERLSQMSDEERFDRLRSLRRHKQGTPPKVFQEYVNQLVGKMEEEYILPAPVGRSTPKMHSRTRTTSAESKSIDAQSNFPTPAQRKVHISIPNYTSSIYQLITQCVYHIHNNIYIVHHTYHNHVTLDFRGKLDGSKSY